MCSALHALCETAKECGVIEHVMDAMMAAPTALLAST
jgi:hypothetical protein